MMPRTNRCLCYTQGFFDAEMNRRLMFKNNGSVKRVVKELVQIYKAPVDVKND